MKNLNFINHENGSEGLKNRGLTGLRVAVKSRIGTRSLRNTLLPVLIGTLLLTLGVGQMWAEAYWPYAGFYEVYMTYSYSGNNSNYTFYASDNNSSQSVDLGTLTADFKVTALYMKCYKNTNDWGKSGNICGALMIYNTGSGDNEYQPTWSGYDTDKGWSDTYQAHLRELSKTGCNKVIASYNSGASGSYTAKLCFKMWGSDDNGSNCDDNWWISNNGNNYKFIYKIAPPALNSFTITPTGKVAGSGTSGDPYIIPYGGDLTLVSSGGTKARTDDNSSVQFSLNNSTWGTTSTYTTTTIENITSTSTTSINLYARCKNNSDASLLGAVKTQTIYYRAAALNTITLNKGTDGTSAGSMTIREYATAYTSYTPATKTGWSLKGYYTAVSDGTQIIDANGNLLSNKGGYTNSSGQWIGGTTTLYAQWKQTYAVTYYANFPAGATSTSGSVPTDATEYASGATVTVKTNSGSLAAGGFTFAGWNTEAEGTGTDRAVSSTFSITGNTALYAKWTENMRNVTISAGTGGTVDKTSASVGVATTTTVTATAQPGYRFTGWTATNCNVASTSSASTTLSGNGTVGSGTLVANFSRTYAYLQGRMTVYNAARNSETHIGSSKGGWSESSTRISMDYDGTNHRFSRHTYKTPAQLSETQTDGTAQNQWFSITRSTASGSLTNPTTYHPSSNTDLTTKGIANKKAAQTSTTTANYKFNSAATDGYVILYFDEAGVWFELEHTLNYNGNGSTSGSAPAEAYYNNGTNATAAAANTFSKKNYTFGGWNTTQYITGTTYAAAASVPMTTNTTLYAKWTRDITLNQNGATTNGSTSVTATYNCATLPTITAPSKTGYTFGGWNTANDGSGNIVINTSNEFLPITGWCDSGKRFTRTASDATLYAKWTQTVTLNANTANHGSGANKTATVILNATALSEITHCTPATGYHRVGYYTAATDGTKVLNADGTFAASTVSGYITSSKWTHDGATTLYAHYEPNTYTIAFNANDDNYVGTATGSTASIAATYDVSYTLTANGFSRTGYTFAGWSRNADGSGTQYTDGQSVSNLTSTNGGTVTLYAKWTGSTYTVSLNSREGTCATKSMTVTMGSTYGSGTPALPGSAAVTPPVGYVFDGWYTAAVGGTKVISTTQVTTAVDHTLYAHYVQKAQVYFKNTYGWSNVYVTFDASWDGGQGAGNEGKTYRTMTRIAGTDIWYHDIPDSYLSDWAYNIAFNDTYQSEYHAFTAGHAVFREDFDRKATLFIPTNNTNNNQDGNYQKNGVQYYSTGYSSNSSGPKYTSGYWRTYQNTYCGYTFTYQKSGGSWSSGFKMQSSSASDSTFVYSVHMDANSTYYFAFYKETQDNTNSRMFYYGTEITSAACTNLKLVCDPTNTSMTTTVAGDYTFKLTMKKDGHMYLTVEYPFYTNDYKVVYSYTKGSAKTFESEIIKGRANGKDTISMFIHSGDSATNRSLKIYKCTGITSGTPSWNTNYATITLPSETASGKTSGVYNFIISQDGSKAASGAYWKKYDGNYYIRTSSSDGGWDMYKYRSDNIMTLSEYSMKQTLSAKYSHYYCRYIESTSTDITYTVATDYSPMICPVQVGDATIGGDGVKTLPAAANVRFSWNEETNATGRAYLKSAQGPTNARYLVLHGSDNKVRDAAGNVIPTEGAGADQLHANELLFTDLGNWVYQVELKALPGAQVSLIAKYNNADRYLIGGASSWETIIGGSGSTPYSIKAVYDFKTNRLMTAWIPTGDVAENLTNVDVLLIRHAQEAGTAITFGTGSQVGAQEVIGALEMRYNELVGHVANWTSDSRPLLKFFVSFPFDVNVSDLFGLNSAYGDAYVIEKYDGAERAEKGFFRGDGTTTFWKELKPGDVMNANEGYCVILDNDYFNNDIGNIWQYKNAGSSVYLYFPSASNVGNISSTTKTITIPEHTCTINRTFTTTSGGSGSRTVNHMNTDSHWNMMGVPIFDTHSDNGTAGQPGAVFATSGTDGDGNFNYFYEWSSSTNQFSIHTARNYNFKCMHGYMVQYHGNVTFKTAAAPASVAARRAPQKENYQIELQVLNSNEEILNRTYVELRENACDTFELNEDVYMSYNNRAVNIYTLASAYDVAANVLSIGNHTIPLCAEVTQAGTYKFSMPSNFSGEVVLWDSFNGAHIDLALEDYEVELPKGTIEDRFYLKINIKKLTTAIDGASEEGSLKDGKAHKFLKNDKMYILRNGMLYDAQGKRVQ